MRHILILLIALLYFQKVNLILKSCKDFRLSPSRLRLAYSSLLSYGHNELPCSRLYVGPISYYVRKPWFFPLSYSSLSFDFSSNISWRCLFLIFSRQAIYLMLILVVKCWRVSIFLVSCPPRPAYSQHPPTQPHLKRIQFFNVIMFYCSCFSFVQYQKPFQ